MPTKQTSSNKPPARSASRSESSTVSQDAFSKPAAQTREPADARATPASDIQNKAGQGAQQSAPGKPPLHKENGLAIWSVDQGDSEKRPDYYVKLTRSFGSSLFTGASEQAPVTFNVYAQQKNGPRLTEKEIAQTIKGELVEGLFQSTNPESTKAEYQAYIAPMKIVTTPRKNDSTKENRTLWLGRAFPVFKTDDDQQRVQWGWEVERVIFPLNARHGNKTLTFTPAHAFQLINKGRAIVDGHTAAYVGSEAKHEGHTPIAKLQITAIKQDVAERPKTSAAQHSLTP